MRLAKAIPRKAGAGSAATSCAPCGSRKRFKHCHDVFVGQIELEKRRTMPLPALAAVCSIKVRLRGIELRSTCFPWRNVGRKTGFHFS
jgi:hypothetical protein